MVSRTSSLASAPAPSRRARPPAAKATGRPAARSRGAAGDGDHLSISTLGRSSSLSAATTPAMRPEHAPFLRAARRRSLAMQPWRRALDNAVNICVLGGVVASFLTPAGHIALAVSLGLSWVTSSPEWARPEAKGLRRLANLAMGVSIALAFGSVVSVILCGTGPVGWALSGLASAAVITRLGFIAYTYRDRGPTQALRAAIFEFVGWRVPARTGRDPA